MTTEQANPLTRAIDTLSSLEIVELINGQDLGVAGAVAEQKIFIAQAIDRIAEALSQGGRLIYIGAGTSGRLGVLDAAECPPTFSTPPEMVIGLIAGGPAALTQAIEGAEDDRPQAVSDLQQVGISRADVLVGIATSGHTPYVLSALEYAKSLDVFTVGLTCNHQTPMHEIADLMITPIVGPEVITGSTRMKSGTATKMVLNMLTTGTMIRLGKTYGHWMVDLRATNSKLRHRCVRIVCQLTGVSEEVAEQLLQQANGQLKTAIVAHRAGVSVAEARQRLRTVHGRLREALPKEERQ